MKAYKWLHYDRTDPVSGDVWREPDGDRGSGVKMRRLGRPLTHATGVGGLPYEINEALWEVELDGSVACAPFPEQGEHVRDPDLLRVDEQMLVADRGRLIRRVDPWGGDVADEFSRLCASRARARVLQALEDASGSLREAREVTEGGDVEPTPAPSGPEVDVLRHVARVVEIWLAAPVDGEDAFRTAAAMARAAAASRGAAARTYAALEPTPVGGRDPEATAAISYLQSRRWQAQWLAERVALDDPILETFRGSPDDG